MPRFLGRARSSKAAPKPFGEADIIFLPGYSVKNKSEQDNIANFLNKKGLNSYKHRWRHWENDSLAFSRSLEIETIKSKLPKNEEFGIIAKSVGTLIAAELLSQINKRRVKFVILLGIPINDLKSNDVLKFINVFKNLGVPILCIQNSEDQFGDIAQVQDLLKEVEYEQVIKDAVGHSYNYPEDIYNFISSVF